MQSYDPSLVATLERLDPYGDLDAAHDAWLELHRQGDGVTNEVAALVDRAKKRGRDEQRRRRRREAEFLAKRVQRNQLRLPRESPLPEDEAIRVELQAVVRSSVARLPPIYRAVVKLSLRDLPVRAIARQLGIPQQTVYSRRRRAFRLLKEDERLAGLASLTPNCHDRGAEIDGLGDGARV